MFLEVHPCDEVDCIWRVDAVITFSSLCVAVVCGVVAQGSLLVAFCSRLRPDALSIFSLCPVSACGTAAESRVSKSTWAACF